MSERPPFDPVRASFYLVAAVIGVHAVIVLLGAVECVFILPPTPEHVCDAKGRLGDLLSAALAAALAFTAGLMGGKPPPPPTDKGGPP